MDKKPKRMVPEVRFKGFTDDWEQRKLGELGSVQMNKRIFKSQTSKSGDVPFYKIGTFGKKPDAYISNSLYQDYKEKYPYPSKGDLLISASGSIGRIVEYKGQKAYYQDSNIVWLEHNNHVLNSFLKAFYQIVKWDGTEGSTIKRLYNKNILNTKIKLPKVREQEAIGILISKVDLLLSLQQRKLEQLKQLKKAMLRQLLASKELSPSIRFKNFTEAWEQRKLGKVASFYSGGTPSVSNSNYYGGTIPFIRSSEINSISTELYLSKQGLQNSSAKMVRQGDILYALYGATSGEVGISNIHGAINQAILAIIPNKNYDSKFLVQWLRKNKEAIIKTYLQGGQGNLSGAIVKQIKISFPNFDEQEKIGEFFKQLDFLITLHQRETNILSNLKKFFLQNLFI